MRKLTILICGLLLVAAGCGSSAGDADKAAKATTTTGAKETTTTADPDEPVEMSVATVPTTEASEPADPAVTGKILMLKLQVGDAAKAKEFYGNVFGANSAAEMGGGISIITFPDGPGMVLIPSDDDEGHGAFIIQVPDLEAAKARALDNGATEQKSFKGNPGGQAAKSVDLLDPWGNQVEILQLG